jgi:hypothetical protein
MSKATKEVTVEAIYEKETPKKVRYKIGDYGDDISGTIYFPKGMKNMPKRIVLDIVDE